MRIKVHCQNRVGILRDILNLLVDYGINVEEVDRYVAWPGQATAYMIGMLRIVELREKAKSELGAKFSLPAFHDMVLGAGSVPLDVLGPLVGGWIAKEMAKA